MKINSITNINFKENTLSREMHSQDAILMLRDKNATIKFQKNREYSRKADSVDTNPIVSLGYKLYRAFNLLTEPDTKGNNPNGSTLSKNVDLIA